ncbi:MAG: DUF1553 domain-containing protein [Planctomycetaceae bacterium]|nr:DUF1553 domain-containing protein [Planctomycetaceae bacterium]
MPTNHTSDEFNGRALPEPIPGPPESPESWRSRPWLRHTTFLVVLLIGIGYLLRYSISQTAIQQVDPAILRNVQRENLTKPLNAVDLAFANAWQAEAIQPTDPADSLLVMRRLSLALTGMPPSLEQIRWAEQIPAADRIDSYLTHLLQNEQTHDYVAERLTRSWVGAENGPFIVFRRQRFVDWLSRQLADNRPYDVIVREMLTARGLWTDHGPVNFFSAQADQDRDNQIDLVRLTGRVSRNFLGMRVDCLQCHNDFTGATSFGESSDPREGLQTDFHGLASFFGQLRLTPTGLHDRLDAPTYEVELLGDKEPTPIPPAVPFGTQWQTWELGTDEADPKPLRTQFTDWLTSTENRPFARAFVNRMWGILLGRPLIEPIDNIPLHGPFPPGLEALTDDFVAHGYDIRRLISLIVHSQPFSLDSRGPHELTAKHEALWAAFPMTKLRPEQMAGTISQVASLIALDDSTHIITQLVRFGEENDFLTRYGDLGDEEFEQDGETVSQRLMLLNGEMASQRLRGQDGLPFNSIVQIDRLAQSPEQIVELLYLIVLTRKPTPHELQVLAPEIASDRRAGIEDLLAVLVNSSEALWNH